MHTFPVMFVFLAWQSDSSFRTSYFFFFDTWTLYGIPSKTELWIYFFSPTKKRDTHRTERPLKLTVFSKLPRYKEECQYETKCTQCWQAWQNLHVCWLRVWSVNDSPQRALTASDLCFHFLVEHHQPMDAHRLMSSEPQLLPPTSPTLSVYTVYTLCICSHSVFVVSPVCSVWGCVCAHAAARRLLSLCVVSPNWGFNTAVLSLAFPSFFPVSAS